MIHPSNVAHAVGAQSGIVLRSNIEPFPGLSPRILRQRLVSVRHGDGLRGSWVGQSEARPNESAELAIVNGNDESGTVSISHYVHRPRKKC